jgi:hypothetical protein
MTKRENNAAMKPILDWEWMMARRIRAAAERLAQAVRAGRRLEKTL